MRWGGSGRSSSRTASPRTSSCSAVHSRLTGQSTSGRRRALRAAAVQLQSTNDSERNLEAADRLTRAAADDGAELVVLPERLDLRGSARTTPPAPSPSTAGRSRGPSRSARELGIDLVAGSIAERREGHERVANTSVHVGPDGAVKAVYRKIHMFDVEVGGVEYRESEHSEPADEIVLSETAERRGAGPDHLLRPALSRAVPHPGSARRPHRHRAGELHPHHRRGALGGAAARPRDREPGLRDRPRARAAARAPRATATATR